MVAATAARPERALAAALRLDVLAAVLRSRRVGGGGGGCPARAYTSGGTGGPHTKF